MADCPEQFSGETPPRQFHLPQHAQPYRPPTTTSSGGLSSFFFIDVPANMLNTSNLSG